LAYGAVQGTAAAIGVGTLAGTAVGGLSEGVEATGHVIMGNKTAGDAFKDAGIDTLGHAKSSLFASASSMAGFGVARSVAGPGTSLVRNIGAGALGGATSATVGTTASVVDRSITAVHEGHKILSEIEASGRTLTAEQRAQFWHDVREYYHLSLRDLAGEYTRNLSAGAASGALGGGAATAQQRATSTLAKVGIGGSQMLGTAGVGFGAAYLRDGTITPETVVAETGNAIIAGVTGRQASKPRAAPVSQTAEPAGPSADLKEESSPTVTAEQRTTEAASLQQKYTEAAAKFYEAKGSSAPAEETAALGREMHQAEIALSSIKLGRGALDDVRTGSEPAPETPRLSPQAIEAAESARAELVVKLTEDGLDGRPHFAPGERVRVQEQLALVNELLGPKTAIPESPALIGQPESVGETEAESAVPRDTGFSHRLGQRFARAVATLEIAAQLLGPSEEIAFANESAEPFPPDPIVQRVEQNSVRPGVDVSEQLAQFTEELSPAVRESAPPAAAAESAESLAPGPSTVSYFRSTEVPVQLGALTVLAGQTASNKGESIPAAAQNSAVRQSSAVTSTQQHAAARTQATQIVQIQVEQQEMQQERETQRTAEDAGKTSEKERERAQEKDEQTSVYHWKSRGGASSRIHQLDDYDWSFAEAITLRLSRIAALRKLPPMAYHLRSGKIVHLKRALLPGEDLLFEDQVAYVEREDTDI
jgi:hypothetical protein